MADSSPSRQRSTNSRTLWDTKRFLNDPASRLKESTVETLGKFHPARANRPHSKVEPARTPLKPARFAEIRPTRKGAAGEIPQAVWPCRALARAILAGDPRNRRSPRI